MSAEYQKGYAAGRRRRRKDEIDAAVRNDRYTRLTAAIFASAMGQNWGVIKNGKHEKYTLFELETMAKNSAHRLVDAMEVFT